MKDRKDSIIPQSTQLLMEAKVNTANTVLGRTLTRDLVTARQPRAELFSSATNMCAGAEQEQHADGICAGRANGIFNFQVTARTDRGDTMIPGGRERMTQI